MKCPICNGCLGHSWIHDKHYLYCDFCRKYFIVINGTKVEVTP